MSRWSLPTKTALGRFVGDNGGKALIFPNGAERLTVQHTQDDEMFAFCFNTAFVNNCKLRIERTMLDGAHKEKHLKHFAADVSGWPK